MKFKKVEIQAFRAYQKKSDGTFDFEILKSNGKDIADFVSLYAPNGFGKTSFYDAVEYGVTNSIDRFLKSKLNEDIAKNERALTNTIGGQKILRNRYVEDDNILSEIRLYTTNSLEPIVRTVPKNKTKKSKDFHFNKSKIENKYFQTVILSQEWIDSFLREDNPTERYEKFMEYFGDSGTGKYYKNVVDLINLNNKHIKELNNLLVGIQKELNFDGDKNILNKVNDKINELNKLGEKLYSIDEYYTESDSLKLSNSISENISNLDFNKTKRLELIRFIDEVFSGSVNMKGINVYFDSKVKLNELEIKEKVYVNIIKNFDKDKKLRTEQSKISHTQKDLIKGKEKLEIIEKLIPVYEKTEKELNRNTILIKDEENKKVANDKIIKELKISVPEQQIKSDQLDKKIRVSLNKFKETEELNTKSISEKTKLESIKALIKKANEKLKLSKEFELEKKNELDNYEIAQKEIEKGQYPSVFDKYFSIFKDINKIENSQKLLKQEQDNLSRFNLKIKEQEALNKDIELFISKGSEIIDKTKKSTCPLCSHDHKTFKSLSDKVSNNQLLSKSLSSLLKQRTVIENEINLVSNKLEKEIKSFVTIFNQEYLKKKRVFSELTQKILIEIEDIEKLDAEKNIIETFFKTYIDLINNESFEKYRNKALDSIEGLKSENKLLSEIFDKIKDSLSKKVTSNNVIENKIQLLKDLNLELKQNSSFIEVKEYFISSLSDKETKMESIREGIENITLRIHDNNLRTLSIEEEIIELSKLLKNTTLEFSQKQLDLFGESKESFQKTLISFQREIQNKLEINISEFDKKSLSSKLDGIKSETKKIVNKTEIIIHSYHLLKELKINVEPFLKFEKAKKEESEIKAKKQLLEKKIKTTLNKEKEKVSNYLNEQINSFFYEDLINDLYKRIDPHPEYKNIKFVCDFKEDKPKLNICLHRDENDEDRIIPNLYFSTAQLNILSLSIFLAKALNAKDDEGKAIDSIFIDDPIQSMDSINILSTIDLIRSLVLNQGKQIILSTHDENFHKLLKKKMPPKLFKSKFLELETFGKVKKV
ncbi:MAG: hypothetical protein JKY42_12155 [Flavobacteriales bacterium]|nr:hypothetical protein [Flavobacteriales bacterium]